MTRRFPGLLLVLALAAAPAYAQTTTTTGTPTTSTTTPGGRWVRGNPALCPIDIRLEAFQEKVGEANLGRLNTPILIRLEKSARCVGHATALCDGRLDTDENRARAKLQRCARHFASVRAKIHSH